jgi:lipopolysaccharide transport system ATP-binding protein
MQCPLDDLKAGERIEYQFHFPANLGPGNYSVSTALTAEQNHLTQNFEWRDLALVFTVVNVNRKEFVGCAWNEPTINIYRPSSV